MTRGTSYGSSLKFNFRKILMKSRNHIRRSQYGFTLIELMVVVAILGLLATVAIPQYQDYVMKTKLGNALSAVDSLKTAVALCSQEAGGNLENCSSANAAAAIPQFVATREIAAANVQANGVIQLTLGTNIGRNVDGGIITMTPRISATNVSWDNAANNIANEAAVAFITRYNLNTTTNTPTNTNAS
jgi:type IV pilus assembly protein PilA